MENSNIYKQVFIDAFEIEEDTLSTLEYESIQAWDSVGHMMLIAALEEGFEIMMEMEDIIDLSSFEKGKELLSKYGIVF